MTPHSFRVLRAAVFAIAMLSGGVHALNIEGLNAFAPIAKHGVSATTHQQTLQIYLPHGQRIKVAPWPDFLPQSFAAQNFEGERQILPAGPADRLSFTRPTESRPWLLIGSHSQRGTHVTGDWHLQLIDGTWHVTDALKKKPLKQTKRHASPTGITAGAERWQVYLLDTIKDTQRNGIAGEQEARISWVAVRKTIESKTNPHK